MIMTVDEMMKYGGDGTLLLDYLVQNLKIEMNLARISSAATRLLNAWYPPVIVNHTHSRTAYPVSKPP
jgi:hypothetical protein